MIIGEVCKRLRLLRGLTQDEVSKQANLTQGYYSAIENGGIPSLETLSRLSQVFEVPLLFIICLATEKQDMPKKQRGWYSVFKKEWDNIIEEVINSK